MTSRVFNKKAWNKSSFCKQVIKSNSINIFTFITQYIREIPKNENECYKVTLCISNVFNTFFNLLQTILTSKMWQEWTKEIFKYYVSEETKSKAEIRSYRKAGYSGETTVWFTGHQVSNRSPINTGTGLCCLNTEFKWRSAGDTPLIITWEKPESHRHFIATQVY